jgi:hypothetical protein
MATITYATSQAANDRSRELWTAILGRPKNAQDVTEYLYGRDGANVVVPARDAYLDTLLRQDQMTNAEMLALVSLYPAYQTNHAYAVGDLFAYNNQLYKVAQSHTSQADWVPSTLPALYTPVAPGNVVPEWVQPSGAQDAYVLDALVTRNGRVWKSLKNANTDTPGVVGTWRDQSNPPLWVVPAGSIGLWQVNDVASYNGQTWRNTSANNSFAPGVFGWVLV